MNFVSARRDKTIYLHVFRTEKGWVKLPALPVEVRSVALLNGESYVHSESWQAGGEYFGPGLNPVDTIVKIERVARR